MEEPVLDIMRKHAGSWWIKAILIAVALSFVIGFGILNRMDNDNPARYVVKVGDTLVTPDEFNDLMTTEQRNYAENYGTEMSEDDLINAQDTIISGRIDQILETNEANRLGLIITDSEVADTISQEYLFQKDGEFDYDTYKDFLDNYMGYSEAAYENMIRQGLLTQKLREVVTDAVKVTEDDIMDAAKSQGKEITSIDELSPDEREYYANIALAVKRFSTYRDFLNALKSEQDIKINQDYLYTKKNG
jgi:peptidyl-prolyl cis-trans isomerase D